MGEFKNLFKTEYSTTCETEYSTQCKTEYAEVCETVDHPKCHTEHEQECHTEYAEKCWDEPECWVEQKEECHHVQVKVHHQPKQQYKKWKRSAEDAEEELGADLDGGSRKERSLLTAAVGLGALGAANTAGFVGGAHVGKKVGLAAGLAISGGLSKRSAMDSEAEDMGE